MNTAIITARGGSESISGKNLLSISGKPLLEYQVEAARDAELVDKVYVSTDSDDIASIAESLDCRVLRRPEHLQGDVAHGDVIQNAVRTVDGSVDALDIAVILLGNTAMVDGDLIDMTIEVVMNRDADSAMTVWKAEDDHPQRAMRVDESGYLKYYGETYDSSSTNRQNYDDVFYYDNGPWALKKDCVEDRNGPGPWWWMGEHCVPVEREWVTGRDIHDFFDVAMQEWYIEHRDELRSLEERHVVE